MAVRLADMSTFLRFAVVRTHALSPLCVRFRHFDRVRPAPQLEPSHLVPAGSHYSQVPDVGLGHSQRRRKIPRLLRSALLHKPLNSAHSRSGPPACWQRRSYEVSNRTGRAPRTQPDEHVTLPPTSCCQRSKCRTLRMMRPPPPPKVIDQPSQAGWPRPGRRTASAGFFLGCRALRPLGPSHRPAKKLKHATIVANRAGEANTRVSKDAERALRQATSGKHEPGITAGTPHTSRRAGLLTRPAAQPTTGTNGPQQPPRLHGGGRESKSTRSRWRPGPTRRMDWN